MNKYYVVNGIAGRTGKIQKVKTSKYWVAYFAAIGFKILHPFSEVLITTTYFDMEPGKKWGLRTDDNN